MEGISFSVSPSLCVCGFQIKVSLKKITLNPNFKNFQRRIIIYVYIYSTIIFYSSIHLFKRKRGKERKEKDSPLIHWFTPPNFTRVCARPELKLGKNTVQVLQGGVRNPTSWAIPPPREHTSRNPAQESEQGTKAKYSNVGCGHLKPCTKYPLSKPFVKQGRRRKATGKQGSRQAAQRLKKLCISLP